MTDAEVSMLTYNGRRAASERAVTQQAIAADPRSVPAPAGASDAGMTGLAQAHLDPADDEGGGGDHTLKHAGGLQIHANTSREAELYMLEEAAIRIQRAYRSRKAARLEYERQRFQVTRDDADAYIDADVFDACYRGQAQRVRELLARGASVNASGAFGQYPLHYAVAGGSREVVALLLENAASVNTQDAKGDTPLHVAARSGDIEVVKTLVRRRGGRSARAYAGQTARAIARRYGDTLAAQELAYTEVTVSDLKKMMQEGTLVGEGSEDVYGSDHEEDELTKISVRELDVLRKDLDHWRSTARRLKARERLAAKRAHNWEQQYHKEIDPLKFEVDRQAAEIVLYQKDLAENFKLHQGAKDAINEAELARHAMFLKKRQAEFDLTAVQQQMKDAERGIEYTRERMSNDMETMEQERNRYRDEARQTSGQMEESMSEVKKLETQLKLLTAQEEEHEKVRTDMQVQLTTLETRFNTVKDARATLADRVKALMDSESNLKRMNDQLRRENQMLKQRVTTGMGGGGGMGMMGGGGGMGMMMGRGGGMMPQIQGGGGGMGMMGGGGMGMMGGGGMGMQQGFSPQPPRGGGHDGRRRRHRHRHSDY